MNGGYRADGSPIDVDTIPLSPRDAMLARQLNLPVTRDPMTGELALINLDLRAFFEQQYQFDVQNQKQDDQIDEDIFRDRRNFDYSREKDYANPSNLVQRYGATNMEGSVAVTDAIKADYARRANAGMLNPAEIRSGIAYDHGVGMPNQFEGQQQQASPTMNSGEGASPWAAPSNTQIANAQGNWQQQQAGPNAPWAGPYPNQTPPPQVAPQQPPQAAQAAASPMSMFNSAMASGPDGVNAVNEGPPDSNWPGQPQPPPGGWPRDNDPTPVMPQPTPPPGGWPREQWPPDSTMPVEEPPGGWPRNNPQPGTPAPAPPVDPNPYYLPDGSQNPEYWWKRFTNPDQEHYKAVNRTANGAADYAGAGGMGFEFGDVFPTKADRWAFEQRNGLQWLGHEGLPPGMLMEEAIKAGIVDADWKPTRTFYKGQAPAAGSEADKYYFNGNYVHDVLGKTPIPGGLEGVVNQSRVQELPGGQAKIGGISAYDLGRLNNDQTSALGSFTSAGGESLDNYLQRSQKLNVGTGRRMASGIRPSSMRR